MIQKHPEGAGPVGSRFGTAHTAYWGQTMVEDLKLYIGGEWTEGTGDAVHELISPVTGDLKEFTDPQTVVIDIDNVK